LDLYKIKKAKRKESQLCILYENVKHYTKKFEGNVLDEKIYLNKMQELNKKIEDEKRKIEKYQGIEDEVYYFVIYKMDKVEKKDIFPLKEYQFEGHKFLGPNNADAILRYSYGDYMAIPDYENRKPHYSYVKYKDEEFEYLEEK
jgi:phosphorylcholine metabolism protein LicD